MAAGFPVKANYATGDVLTAANLNDMAGTLNYLDPTAKGDLFPASDASTLTRLAVGSNGQVLTADSTTATGLKWAAPSSAGANYTLLNSPSGTTLTGASTITVSGISGIEKIYIRVINGSSASASSNLGVRINTDTGGNYEYDGGAAVYTLTYGSTTFLNLTDTGADRYPLGTMAANAASKWCAGIHINGGTSTGYKHLHSVMGTDQGGSNGGQFTWMQGLYKGSAAITSVSVVSSVGNFDGGTLYVYGSNA